VPALLIVCVGPAASKKSTTAVHLVTTWGFTPVALAEPLPAWAQILGLPLTLAIFDIRWQLCYHMVSVLAPTGVGIGAA
jgi:hypothetical protein